MHPVVGKAAVRHTLILSIALAALAGAAEAQSRPPANGQAAGLRYLTWTGKADPAPESVAPDRAAPAPSVSSRRSTPARSSAPRVIPHGGAAAAASVPAPTSPRSGLTPANAWMRPPPARTAEAPQPLPIPSPAPPPIPAATAQPAPPVAADPMAPRRDAPIFRLGAATPPTSTGDAALQPARQAAAAPGSQARYYSLHRQNGRQPDAIAMPSPVYLDALPVELERTPQSEDLAEPPAAPAVLRDSNGRVRPAPPTNIDDIP